MTDNNKNFLNINTFIKLIKIAQNFSKFKSYKILFLYDYHCFS